MVMTMLSRRWADDVESEEEGDYGDSLTSEAMQELNDKLYPETESLRDVERFLSSFEADKSPGAEGAAGAEGARKGKSELVREARELLAKVETITRVELPIQIRARKAAARAQLIQYLHQDDAPGGGGGDASAKGNELLEKAFIDAVKLDPDNVQCWNGVAKALWVKGDLESAQLCYQKSLEQQPDKQAYQNLSMLQRQLARGEKPDQSREKIDASLTNAKAAVALDVQDGHSWYLLGNAYLFEAFTVSSSERDQLVDKSLKTYRHAMKLHHTSSGDGGDKQMDPDLKFNYGVVCKYLEMHLEALKAFEYCDQVRRDSHI